MHFAPRRALIGLLGISAALAATPLAATSATTGFTAAPAAAVSHIPHTLHAGSNSNWGGYAVTGGTFKSVTGNWVVPSLDCAATAGDVSFWSGLDGFTSTSVEQIGLDAVCTKTGKIQYNPWVEMYPANSIYFTETVKAGDTVKSSVTTTGTGSFTLTLSDSTQGWTKKYVKSLASAKLSSAEVTIEAIGGGNIAPCPDFGTIGFSDVTANGKSFATAGTVQTMNIERNGVELTKDGPLSGTSFSAQWLHK